MNRLTKPLLLLTLLTLLISSPPRSLGAALGDFATEHTQIMNNIELLAIHGIDVEQLENMLLNTLAVSGSAWTKTQQDLLDLHKTVQRGIAIAYSSSAWEQRFLERYPGYRIFTDEDDPYIERYKTWTQGTLDGIRGALAAANLQMDQLDSEDKIIEQLKTMASTTTGRHQALMVGNMVTTEMVQQLRKLRELNMAHLQLQTAYLASQAQIEAEREAISKKIFEHDLCKSVSGALKQNIKILTGATLKCN